MLGWKLRLQVADFLIGFTQLLDQMIDLHLKSLRVTVYKKPICSVKTERGPGQRKYKICHKTTRQHCKVSDKTRAVISRIVNIVFILLKCTPIRKLLDSFVLQESLQSFDYIPHQTYQTLFKYFISDINLFFCFNRHLLSWYTRIGKG